MLFSILIKANNNLIYTRRIVFGGLIYKLKAVTTSTIGNWLVINICSFLKD